MVNAMTCISKVSGYYKKINGATGFCYFPCDAETELRKGMRAIFMLD